LLKIREFEHLRYNESWIYRLCTKYKNLPENVRFN
jgi:hypothetical protein